MASTKLMYQELFPPSSLSVHYPKPFASFWGLRGGGSVLPQANQEPHGCSSAAEPEDGSGQE